MPEASDQLIEQLRKYADAARDVAALLVNPIKTTEYLERKQIDVEQPTTDSHSHFLRGKYLYMKFHCLATEPHPQRDLIRPIVDDADFLAFIFVLHEIPNGLGIKKLEFHMRGTTSFIFRASNQLGNIYALKLIQAPYQQVEEVRTATSNYKATYSIGSKHAPVIHESHPTWMLMEFIDGDVLSEYLAALRGSKSEPYMSDPYFVKVTRILAQIIDALAFLESLTPSISHGDLSPLNIIANEQHGIPSIKLIDFGANYVLQNVKMRPDTMVGAFALVETFVAPEVLRRGGSASVDADLYSVGMITLDLLSDKPLTRDVIGKRLKELWERPATSGFAQIIEDLIDNNPKKRLLMLNVNSSSVYKVLNEAIQEKALLFRQLAEESRRGVDPEHLLKQSLKPDVWKALLDILKIIRSKDRNYTDITRGMFVATTINAFCQATIVSAFVLYTIFDIKTRWLSGIYLPFIDSAIDWIAYAPKDFLPGDVWGNLPGRCVALTFGLIAARYYANIYAPLNTPAWGDSRSRWTRFVLRFNAFSYFLPIMLAVVWNPHWWPWCAFLGLLLPTINNYLCLKFAERAAEKAAVFSVEALHESERFLTMYTEWWVQMGIYAFGIGLLGVLLRLGIASDEAIYAYSVCFINIGKIYRNNCGTMAPEIQGGLARLFFNARRWLALTGRDLPP
jgi:serine/threonine protein kinase